MERKGVSWRLVLPPPPPASSEVFRSPCGWGMHSWSLLHAGPETPWIDENSPPLGIFVKMLGGQEQETEVVADVETGPEPLHPPKWPVYAARQSLGALAPVPDTSSLWHKECMFWARGISPP